MDTPLIDIDTEDGLAPEVIEPEVELVIEPGTELARPRETAIDADGWIYDVNSGEVLGHRDCPERFEVDSADAAEWVLELRSKLEADILAIDLRIQAVLEMLRAMKAERTRRLSWWDWRFSTSLIEFARKALEGTKARTAKFGWGQVRFRKTAGNHLIVDMPAAVAWMKTWAPQRVKVVESVTVKDVLAAMEVEARATGEPAERPSWLASSGERESVTITTGLDTTLRALRNGKGGSDHGRS